MPQPDSPCPTCGWRREHVTVDGFTLAKCPYCHQDEVVE